MKIYPNMPAAQERLNEIRLRQALLSKEMRHQISRTKSNDPLIVESAKAELHSLNSEERRLLAERNSVESQYYDLKELATVEQKKADNIRAIVCAIIAAGDDERDFEIIDRAADIEESIQNLIAQA